MDGRQGRRGKGNETRGRGNKVGEGKGMSSEGRVARWERMTDCDERKRSIYRERLAGLITKPRGIPVKISVQQPSNTALLAFTSQIYQDQRWNVMTSNVMPFTTD